MSTITTLEKLCYPVFQCVCNYWQLNGITGNVEMEKFRRDIIRVLDEAKARSEQDAKLAQEYAWIEKPLVFFIDYLVKEGRFAFSREWQELSRNYNELSGDEKFFDLLSETMENPARRNAFALFYIMLGLGFDGVHRFDQEYIQERMRLCMEKASAAYDIYSEPVVPPQKKKNVSKRQWKFNIRKALIASMIFMAACFIINLAVMVYNTQSYRATLQKTVIDSAPKVRTGVTH